MMSNDLVNIFTGTYRGVVKDNYDPEIKGRLKIWIPSIYPHSYADIPNYLPWSEPVMPLFVGNYTNRGYDDLNRETGVTTILHSGAELWVFFENADHNYPKHFGACQSGSGWLSEHNNQHLIKTDNVRVRIDENPSISGSTCKFNTYNDKCTDDSILDYTNENSPTRVDIEIKIKSGCALNLKIVGDVNMSIVGNVYEDIRGSKHETLSGDFFRNHIGNSHIVQKGDIFHEQTGSRTYIQYVGDETEIQLSGNKTHQQYGDKLRMQVGNSDDTQIQGEHIFTQFATVNKPVPIYKETLIEGNSIEYVSKSQSEVVLESAIKIVGETATEIAGIQSSRLAPVVIDYPAVTTRAAASIVDQAKKIDHKKG